MRRPLRVLLAVALALSAGVASGQVPGSLREAFERAWERAVAARVGETRQAGAEAARLAADSLFPQAPALGIAQRDDRYNNNRGLRERELELVLPLWLPGQRAASRALAESEIDEGATALAAARLALAGELRATVWAHAAARADAELARERLSTAEQLAAEVARREAAGDLARTDLLQAREEMLAARGALAASNARERQAFERYRLLTGTEVVPAPVEESPATGAEHPRRRQAESALARAHAELRLARETNREAPELSLGWQQSREDLAAAERGSLRFGLRIPLATEGRNAPRIAAANGGAIRAEAELRQVVAEIDAEQREARATLDHAEAERDAAVARADLAGERLRLLQRAFELGELPLGDLLRARAAAGEARLDAQRTRYAVLAARARLNQSLGVLP